MRCRRCEKVDATSAFSASGRNAYTWELCEECSVALDGRLTDFIRGWRDVRVDGAEDPTAWGMWKLDRDTLELVLQRHGNYPVDLEHCNSADEMNDWLKHINGRFGAQDWRDFRRAILEIMGHSKAFLAGKALTKRQIEQCVNMVPCRAR